MITRPESKQGIPMTANARKIFDIRYGEQQAGIDVQLNVDDMRSINGCSHPYYNYFFDLILTSLRHQKIKPFTQIELTEHAAGMTFAGLDELEKYLLQNGCPEGFKIFIAVDEMTHPMVRAKALRLERLFSHSDPYLRLTDYLKNPESDTTIHITSAMRSRYDSETKGSLVNDICKLIASGKLAPRTKIIFEDNTIINEAEAQQLADCILANKPASGFHVYIPPTSRDKKNITAIQGKIWDYLEARQNADKALAMSVFLSGGQFNQHFTHAVFVDKGIAANIYQHLDSQLEGCYQKAAALQLERVKERAESRRRWNFFKAAAVAVGGFALAVGASALIKHNK